MPQETHLKEPDPETGSNSSTSTSSIDHTKQTHQQEITELNEKITSTRKTKSDRETQAERLRVQIARTRVAYDEGLPVHLLRGTEHDQIKKYAQALKNWKG